MAVIVGHGHADSRCNEKKCGCGNTFGHVICPASVFALRNAGTHS
jgi:hypothetical protein